MPLDPRLPVIVGAAQAVYRPDPSRSLEDRPEPVEMMVEALRTAGEDSGAGDRLLRDAQSVRVNAPLSWQYADPGMLIAGRLGAEPRESVLTTTGGNSPQLLVNDAAHAIARGELDTALIAGAEAMYTRLAARKDPSVRLRWTRASGSEAAPRMLGDDRNGTHPVEQALSLVLPVQIYPCFENSLRAFRDEGLDEHQRKVADLWSRFSEVASKNPFAWSQRRFTPEEIREPTPENRMIAFPYPKLMNANIQTDQSAALVICSVARASDAGVPEDRWVFVHAGAEANDHWFVSEREDLHSSPAIRAVGRSVLDATGIGPDDLQHIDLYSCFPSAVQIAAAELGLPLDDADRPLTATGGLGFAGGPGNNYSTHAIAAIVHALRDAPGSYGLVTSVGWYLTKHAAGVYSTEPPKGGFSRHSGQAEVDRAPKRQVDGGFAGISKVETYTVTFERDGTPSRGHLSCLVDDGSRAWGEVSDTDTLADMVSSEQCGRPVRIGPERTAELL